jgi:Tol biopolymer transport system component
MLAFGCGTEYSTNCRPQVGMRVRRADGRGRIRVLTHNRTDDHPAWSPDGESVVFTRYPGGGLLRPELWIYNARRSRLLTEGASPAWSVNGEIAFVRGGSSVYVIRPDGTGLRQVTEGLDPEWSPDGRRLIYNANPGLYTIGRLDGRKRRLAGFGILPDFSPDGRGVVFTAGAHDRIVTIRRNRSDRRVVFRSEG